MQVVVEAIQVVAEAAGLDSLADVLPFVLPFVLDGDDSVLEPEPEAESDFVLVSDFVSVLVESDPFDPEDESELDRLSWARVSVL
jgi:hypothetical protein